MEETKNDTNNQATEQSAKQSTPDSQARSNAVLAWVFAPFTSFAWKDDSNELLRSHARESLYVGIAQFAVAIGFSILQAIFYSLFFSGVGYGFFGLAGILALCFNLLWLGVLAFGIVPRIMGVVAANDGREYHMPAVTDLVKKFIKL